MKLSVLALVLLLMLAGTYQAKASSFVVDLYQDGANVVANGSGDINVEGLAYFGPATSPFSAVLNAQSGAVVIFGSSGGAGFYGGGDFTGPTSFGSGSLAVATSASGNPVGLDGGDQSFYFLGTQDVFFTDSATWDNATLSSLGVTPGTYTWTWDGGADSFTLNAFVPEPSQYGFGFVVALVGLFTVRQLRTA